VSLARLIQLASDLDTRLFQDVNQGLSHPLLDRIMPWITEKHHFVVPLVILMLALLLWGGQHARQTVLLGLILVILTDQTGNLLKLLVARVRPCHVVPATHLLVGCTGSGSFPSNHVLNLFGQSTLIAARWRPVAIPAFLAASIVAFSRVYVGVHYPGDAIGSAGMGIVCGWFVSRGALEVNRRWVKSTVREA
jgi:undecaprenyl-diphosphatase